ncbi:MAG: hypothetical protein GX603_05140 [Chloroflexi bacterium]|nr:hypothetical protein [Chloroflexota bacterium]
MKKWIVILISLIILFGCSPKPEQLQPLVDQTLTALPTRTTYPTNTPYSTYTPMPTYTLMPTYTPLPTYTKAPTLTQIVKVVTATETSTPLYTATITNTATSTATQTATSDPLKAPRGNGFYLVGTEIAPGVWDSDGSGDRCYWEVSNAQGDIISNHFGLAGGTAYVPSSAFQVLFEDCGTWTWLQP